MALTTIVRSQTLARKHSPHPDRSNNQLVDTHQAAEFLGLTASTLARWRMLRTGPPWRKLNGFIVRYALQDLEAFAVQGLKDPQQR